jgi:hypothetical protein
MKKILHCLRRLTGNLTAHGNIKIPRSRLLHFIASLFFLFAFSFADAQRFFPGLSSSNSITKNSDQHKNIFSSHYSFDEKNDRASKVFAKTSVASGPWNSTATWGGGAIPGTSDDVIIDAGTTVTVDANSASNSLTINSGGALNFSGTSDLEVDRDFTNNGSFTAGSGTVSFKGTINGTISGSSPTSFNTVIINKGTDLSYVVEANGTAAISNTGDIIITNGLFRMTTGTFQFKSNPHIPVSAGIDVNGATLNTVGSFSYDNNGLIKITAGTANFGTASGNDLATASGGKLEIDGGNVNIAGSLINTAGTAIITGGTINLATVGNASAQGSFHMSLSTDLTISGNPTIILNKRNTSSGGDITILNSTGTKTITGGNFQIGSASSVSGSSFLINSAIPLNDLTVFSNNISAGLSNVDLSVNNNLILNGPLLLNAQNLIIGQSAPAVSGTLGTGNGVIVTNGTGELRKMFTVIASYLFPVSSSAAQYTPVDLNFTSGTYMTGAYVAIKTVGTKNLHNTNTNNYLNRYWTVNTSNIANILYDVTATYLASDVVGNECYWAG